MCDLRNWWRAKLCLRNGSKTGFTTRTMVARPVNARASPVATILSLRNNRVGPWLLGYSSSTMMNWLAQYLHDMSVPNRLVSTLVSLINRFSGQSKAHSFKD